MTKERILIITRKKELEDYLNENYPKEKANSEVISLFFQDFSELRDIKYLIDAYQMPIKEIEEAIEYYDSHSVLDKPDELLFIKELAQKYGVEKSKIIKRIQDVRAINRLKKGEFKIKKRKKREKQLYKSEKI